MAVAVGTKVDQLCKIDDKIKAQSVIMKKEEVKLNKLKALYAAKEEEIFKLFPKEKLIGAHGKMGSVTIDKKDYPTVEDWDQVYKYISRNKAFDMLQKRLSSTAVNERWAAGKKVPGVGKFTKTTLKLKRTKQ